MVISPVQVSTTNHFIRPLNMLRDLDAVADLIEESFSLKQDADGQAFIREMRKAARDARFIDWAGGFQEPRASVPKGFVWVEDGKVVGNISLIPFEQHKQKIYLIANVAVKEAYRRRGIARALTQHALEYLRQRALREIWLQVNMVNQAAIDLYQSLGFRSYTTLTTWQLKPFGERKNPGLEELQGELQRRKNGEDKLQQQWLERLYPETITWYFPVSFEDFKQKIFWYPSRWGEAFRLKHKGLREGGLLKGFVSWQHTNVSADNLWLAINPQCDLNQTVSDLLLGAVASFPRRKMLKVDFPQGDAVESFRQNGFEEFRSLVWMKYYPEKS